MPYGGISGTKLDRPKDLWESEGEMDSTLYTIESDVGPYLSEDPSFPDRKAAWLYHEPSAAAQVIANVDPAAWRVTPVTDLETWLDSLLEYDITHVVESLGAAPSVTRTTAGWLLMLRAQQSGREMPKKP